MRLGGPIFAEYDNPGQWVSATRALEYGAVFCPVDLEAEDGQVKAYAGAAKGADITIAEVGAWSNPLSPDDETRTEALEKCKKSLALAEAIGARCCVNIAGSRGDVWDGAHSGNLTPETFDRIVQTVREIIDDVNPQRTFYTLETMPWMYPDTADSYVDLVQAIDRPQFGVHFDPVNLISSPQRYYNNTELVTDFVEKLGPQIKSCHAKDIFLQDQLTVHLNEVRPGQGALDYPAFLQAIAALPEDVPVMLEHLSSAEEYAEAAAFIRETAADAKLEFNFTA